MVKWISSLSAKFFALNVVTSRPRLVWALPRNNELDFDSVLMAVLRLNLKTTCQHLQCQYGHDIHVSVLLIWGIFMRL